MPTHLILISVFAIAAVGCSPNSFKSTAPSPIAEEPQSPASDPVVDEIIPDSPTVFSVREGEKKFFDRLNGEWSGSQHLSHPITGKSACSIRAAVRSDVTRELIYIEIHAAKSSLSDQYLEPTLMIYSQLNSRLFSGLWSFHGQEMQLDQVVFSSQSEVLKSAILRMEFFPTLYQYLKQPTEGSSIQIQLDGDMQTSLKIPSGLAEAYGALKQSCQTRLFRF